MKKLVLLIILLSIENLHSQTDLSMDTKTNFKDKAFELNKQKIDSLKEYLKIFKYSIKSFETKSENDSSFSIHSINTIDKKIDSLENEISKLQNKDLKENNFPNNFRSIIGFTDSKKGTATGDFWEDKINNSIILSLPVFENRSTLFGEMLVDHIGAFRIALSSSVTASTNSNSEISDSTNNSTEKSNEDNTVENFINSGGNLTLKTDFPLLYWGNIDDTNEKLRNTRSIGIYASNRISLNAPALGGSVEKPDGLVEFALEPQFRFLTNKELIGFVGRMRIGYVITSTDQKRTLTNENGKTFGYIMASITLNIKDSFLINFSSPVSSGNSQRPIDNASVILSVTAAIGKK